MLGGGASRGKARSRSLASSSCHPSHSFPLLPSTLSSLSIHDQRNSHMSLFDAQKLAMVSPSPARSIDLRRKASVDSTKVDPSMDDHLRIDATYGSLNKSTEILPMLLETPTLSILSEVSSESSKKGTQYIPASSSPGLLPSEGLEKWFESEKNKGDMKPKPPTKTVRNKKHSSGDQSKIEYETKVDSIETNYLRTDGILSVPSSEFEAVKLGKKRSKNNVVLEPIRKRGGGDSGSGTSSSEEEERKESGDTDSEIEETLGFEHGAGLKGLKNLGNTCYMNSTLQALSQIHSLREYMLKHKFLSDLNTHKSKAKGELASVFADLMKQLWAENRTKTVQPVEFKRLVGDLDSRFSGYQQHDAQEFILFLLDALHEDMNRIRVDLPFEELIDIEGETVQARSERCWKNFTERNDSVIIDTFCGQLFSEIICEKCGKVSTVFEPFMDLSVPIVDCGKNGKIRVKDCLETFTKPENLSGFESVYCSTCKDHCDAQKTMTIHKLPEVLIIHLKRFSSQKKLVQSVEIPVDDLHMRPFVTTLVDRSQENCSYRLIGAVNHMGSFYGGHYTADCFSSEANSWFNFNDTIVSKIDASRIDSEDAYLLVYQRVDPNQSCGPEKAERSNL